MNKNSAKDLQGINFSQLSLTEKTGVKNVGHETLGLVSSQSSSRRIQTCVRKFNAAAFVNCKWLRGCAARNALFSLMIGHLINRSRRPTTNGHWRQALCTITRVQTECISS
jgi:hypothetical protein